MIATDSQAISVHAARAYHFRLSATGFLNGGSRRTSNPDSDEAMQAMSEQLTKARENFAEANNTAQQYKNQVAAIAACDQLQLSALWLTELHHTHTYTRR